MPMSHSETLVPEASASGSWNIRWQLMCPACGDGTVDRVSSADHDSVTVHPDRDANDSPIGTRGGYIRIDLTCSAGHGFALIVANHKGAEYVGVVPRL